MPYIRAVSAHAQEVLPRDSPHGKNRGPVNTQLTHHSPQPTALISYLLRPSPAPANTAALFVNVHCCCKIHCRVNFGCPILLDVPFLSSRPSIALYSHSLQNSINSAVCTARSTPRSNEPRVHARYPLTSVRSISDGSSRSEMMCASRAHRQASATTEVVSSYSP